MELLEELGFTMEVVAQVLLGPNMPALSYLCGPWRGAEYLSPDSVDLAVKLLDKAYERELPFMHKNMQDTLVSARFAVKLLQLQPWDHATENSVALEALRNETGHVADCLHLARARELLAPLPAAPTSIKTKVQGMVDELF